MTPYHVLWSCIVGPQICIVLNQWTAEQADSALTFPWEIKTEEAWQLAPEHRATGPGQSGRSWWMGPHDG